MISVTAIPIKRIQGKKLFLFLECAFLFFIIPFTAYFIRQHLAFKIILIVFTLAAACAWYLVRDKNFDTRKLWRTKGLSGQVKQVFLMFIGPALFMTLFTCIFMKPHFLEFPRDRFNAWLMFVLWYPLLSAYPQELIFRSFFFQRYRELFPNPIMMLIISGISFGLAHMVYGNWIAPVASVFAGIFFGYRYMKSGSLVVTSIEHGLWGNFLFTVGMGWFFYSGSIS